MIARRVSSSTAAIKGTFVIARRFLCRAFLQAGPQDLASLRAAMNDRPQFSHTF